MEVAEFLAHHGIRGMKWGVRRSAAQLARESGVPKSNDRAPWHSPPPPKEKAAPHPHPSGASHLRIPKEKGKQPSADALEIMELRQKVKHHGASSLTNEDLQKIAKRAELQQKYNAAFPKKPSKKAMVARVAVDLILSKEGSKKVSSFATTKVSNPYTANLLYDLFKPDGPASQINQIRKTLDQAKNKGKSKK